MPRHRSKQLSSAFFRNEGTKVGVFARDPGSRRPVRATPDSVWRSDRPLDSPLCGRSIPGVHAFAGRDGGPLATRRRSGCKAKHHCEWSRGRRDRSHRSRCISGEVCARCLGHHAADPWALCGDGLCASPLSPRLLGDSECNAVGVERSYPAAGHLADSKLEPHRQEGAALRSEDLSAHTGCSRGLRRRVSGLSSAVEPLRRRTNSASWRGHSATSGPGLTLSANPSADCGVCP